LRTAWSMNHPDCALRSGNANGRRKTTEA
jgi:hypothetical protein